MPDRTFDDSRLAALYDPLCTWGSSEDFYLQLVMSANAVLDVGCGTGTILTRAREEGHTGRLVGLDPARGMLGVAREKRSDVDWILGDLNSETMVDEFDLVIMTGHAFQVFLTDDDIRSALAEIRTALHENGRLAFETRNRLARAWESWTPDDVTTITDATGNEVRFWRTVTDATDDAVVTFTHTFSSGSWSQDEMSQSTLRFLSMGEVEWFVSEAGFTITDQFGDWDRSPFTPDSPEIITIATLPAS